MVTLRTVTSEESGPSTAPIETVEPGEERVREMNPAMTPWSSCAWGRTGSSSMAAPATVTARAKRASRVRARIIIRRPADADVEGIGPLAGAPLQRHRDVETDGSDGGVVAQAEAGGVAHGRGPIGEGSGIGLAHIEEGHDADRVGDLDPRLQRGLEQALAAGDIAERIAGTEAFVVVAADRAAAAGIEAPRGRDVGERAAEDGSEGDTTGEDGAGLLVDGVVGGCLEPVMRNVSGAAPKPR